MQRTLPALPSDSAAGNGGARDARGNSDIARGVFGDGTRRSPARRLRPARSTFGEAKVGRVLLPLVGGEPLPPAGEATVTCTLHVPASAEVADDANGDGDGDDAEEDASPPED